MRPRRKVIRIKRCKEKHNKLDLKEIYIMMNEIKKNELTEQEVEQVTGGGALKEIWETVKTAHEIAETIVDVLGLGDESQSNPNITNHGSGASGSW